MTYALASCLSRGGKFIITPGVPKTSLYKESWESYCRSVRLRLFFGNRPQRPFDPRYHVPNPSWQPPFSGDFIESNLKDLWSDIERREAESSSYWRAGKGASRSNTPKSELKALDELMKRYDVIVKPADKNLGLTLMGREWYMQECYRQLRDETTYKEVIGLDSTVVKRTAERFIDEISGFLPRNERKWLLENTRKEPQLPDFYIMPKLHKDPVKGRPIVASHSWCTTPLSKWCSHQLQPIVERLPTVLRDTRSLTGRLDATRLIDGADFLISTLDVESLYTSIPIWDALRAVQDTIAPIFALRGEPQLAQVLVKAIAFVLSQNYFLFDGRVFKQTKGLAMGTPLAPPVANIFMAWLEKKLFTLHPHLCPMIYVRFLDDILVVQNTSLVPHDHLWRELERAHPNIRFTRESSTTSVNFMDLVVYREGKRLLYRVHQKVLNKYLYISPRSCHPRHVIKGFVRTELIRYARNSSKEIDFLRICRAFSGRLRERGFHPCFLRHVFSTVQFGYYPVVREPSRPMVFKVQFGLGSLDHNIARVIREWYDNTPEGFQAIVPRPIVCYQLGRNIYKLLVRARVAT